MNESQVKKLGDRITRAFNIAAGEAMTLATMIACSVEGPEKVKSRSSLLMSWNKDDANRLAGHFYWLSKTYERVGDTGRAVTFKRASKVVYEAINADAGFDFKAFINHKHIGFKVRLEAYDYWLASGQMTSRQFGLNRQVNSSEYPPQMPNWRG